MRRTRGGAHLVDGDGVGRPRSTGQQARHGRRCRRRRSGRRGRGRHRGRRPRRRGRRRRRTGRGAGGRRQPSKPGPPLAASRSTPTPDPAAKASRTRIVYAGTRRRGLPCLRPRVSTLTNLARFDITFSTVYLPTDRQSTPASRVSFRMVARYGNDRVYDNAPASSARAGIHGLSASPDSGEISDLSVGERLPLVQERPPSVRGPTQVGPNGAIDADRRGQGLASPGVVADVNPGMVVPEPHSRIAELVLAAESVSLALGDLGRLRLVGDEAGETRDRPAAQQVVVSAKQAGGRRRRASGPAPTASANCSKSSTCGAGSPCSSARLAATRSRAGSRRQGACQPAEKSWQEALEIAVLAA